MTPICHCEERSDEATSFENVPGSSVRPLDQNCFVASLLAMTYGRFTDSGYQEHS